MRQLLNSYPYTNTLVVEQVTGAELRAALERCASFFTITEDGRVGVAPAFTTALALYNYDIYGIDYPLTTAVGQRVTQLITTDNR